MFWIISNNYNIPGAGRVATFPTWMIFGVVDVEIVSDTEMWRFLNTASANANTLCLLSIALLCTCKAESNNFYTF